MLSVVYIEVDKVGGVLSRFPGARVRWQKLPENGRARRFRVNRIQTSLIIYIYLKFKVRRYLERSGSMKKIECQPWYDSKSKDNAVPIKKDELLVEIYYHLDIKSPFLKQIVFYILTHCCEAAAFIGYECSF